MSSLVILLRFLIVSIVSPIPAVLLSLVPTVFPAAPNEAIPLPVVETLSATKLLNTLPTSCSLKDNLPKEE